MTTQQNPTVASNRLSLPRVATHTRLSATTEAIRSYVLDGHIATGERLTDQELVDSLGVSRATVREAVRQLVHEGILEHEPYKGLRVATLDDQGWLDLAEVRAALEVPAARRLAIGFSPEIEQQLEAGLRRLGEARRHHSAAEENNAHIQFHALVQHLAGNPILERTWEVIEQRARVMLRVDHEVRPDEDRVATHTALVTAIRSGDPDVAAHAVRDHVLVKAQELVEARRALARAEAKTHTV
jgi:DNA-binding GntR family transcriptional regulator